MPIGADEKLCTPFIALHNLQKIYGDRKGILRHLSNAVEPVMPSRCREIEQRIAEDIWSLPRLLVYQGDVADLLEREGIDEKTVNEYGENVKSIYEELVKHGLAGDQALYQAIWRPALCTDGDRRYLVIASLATATVQALWIGNKNRFAVVVAEFINKAEALSHSRIPHDVLVVSNTLSVLAMYASAKLALEKLSPFLVLRPPSTMNPLYLATFPQGIATWKTAERIKSVLESNGVGMYPAMIIALVPSDDKTFVGEVVHTLIEGVHEAWRTMVDYVLDNYVRCSKEGSDGCGVNWGAKCMEGEKLGKIIELVRRARNRPPYQYAVSATIIDKGELLKQGATRHRGLWGHVVEVYTEGHEGASLSKYVWAPLYSVEDLERDRIRGVNKLCTNCYQLISVVEVQAESSVTGKALPCRAGRLALKAREKLCVYCLINRLLENPFTVVFKSFATPRPTTGG